MLYLLYLSLIFSPLLSLQIINGMRQRLLQTKMNTNEESLQMKPRTTMNYIYGAYRLAPVT